MKQKLLTNWRLFWPFQIILTGFIALTATFLPLLLPVAALPLRIALQWIAPCVLGAWTSFHLTRTGFVCYAAWLSPPVLQMAVPWLSIGYPPSIGSVLLCTFVSMVSAASADVLNRQKA